MESSLNFYQVRTLSERFSATYDWVCAHWRVALRNLFPAGMVFVVIISLLELHLFRAIQNMTGESILAIVDFGVTLGGCMLLAALFQYYIYAMAGALLNRSAAGMLTAETRWKDLRGTFFSIVWRLFVQMCIFLLIFAVVTAVVSLPAKLLFNPDSSIAVKLIFVGVMLLVFAAVVALAPSLFLMQCPVYLEAASAWGSIKRGFVLGFRHWGSTFLTFFLVIIIALCVTYIVTMPYITYLILSGDMFGWPSVLLYLPIHLLFILLTPILIVFTAFQYGSISAKEGVGVGENRQLPSLE